MKTFFKVVFYFETFACTINLDNQYDFVRKYSASWIFSESKIEHLSLKIAYVILPINKFFEKFHFCLKNYANKAKI